MVLHELLHIIHFPIIIKTSGAEENYKSKTDIPEEYSNFRVVALKATNNNLVIILDNSEKIPTLEELGYSFEVGV